MVDRLERQGLVERQSIATDRRVKMVALTPRGRRTRAELFEGLYSPPPELSRLGRADLVALRDAAAKLPKRPGPGTVRPGAFRAERQKRSP